MSNPPPIIAAAATTFADFVYNYLAQASAYYGGAAPEHVVAAKARCFAFRHVATLSDDQCHNLAADKKACADYEASLMVGRG